MIPCTYGWDRLRFGRLRTVDILQSKTSDFHATIILDQSNFLIFRFNRIGVWLHALYAVIFWQLRGYQRSIACYDSESESSIVTFSSSHCTRVTDFFSGRVCSFSISSFGLSWTLLDSVAEVSEGVLNKPASVRDGGNAKLLAEDKVGAGGEGSPAKKSEELSVIVSVPVRSTPERAFSVNLRRFCGFELEGPAAQLSRHSERFFDNSSLDEYV